ncbi:AzlC family ABC transporter permease [Chelativorans sp. AA-79]|uniref:AzlC family ABC transporter permease n=1 Tax=Chelativorans sp. AA-79 TaxID=3028735 RepID=UPI0023F739EF|nr:AzlC family ABC transporter permease [Chelativorans sp. AA-79]WEX11359.1 AzlC family ABC transporter permease [Chelativorans sp. AA-79]
MTAESFAEPRPSDDFLAGARASVPVVLAVVPFGLLFGALALEHGLSTFEAVLMSAAIYAGASQMVGIDLFGTKIAPWVIVLSIVAVNFRHVLYSATIGRHLAHWTPLQRLVGFFFLVDPQFAEAEQRVERRQPVSFAWYMGLALPVYLCWVTESWLGALFGRFIPDARTFGLDFILPIYFLAMVMSFRKRPLWLPVVGISAVVSIIAYRTVGSPWHVSIGALAGVLLGALLAPSTSKEEKP